MSLPHGLVKKEKGYGTLWNYKGRWYNSWDNKPACPKLVKQLKKSGKL